MDSGKKQRKDAPLEGTLDNVDSKGCCVGSAGMTVLYVIFFANFGLSIAEVAGYQYASSLVLLSDASHMVLDNITYALNLWARRQRDALNEKAKKSIVTPDMYMRVLHWEVGASIVTAIMLFGSAVYVAGDAFMRLSAPQDAVAPPDDNVMLGIAIASLVINGGVIVSFFAVPALRSIPHSHGGQVCTHDHDANMFAAFSHLLADQLTNSIMIVVTMLIKFHVGGAPVRVDAIGSLLGCGMTAAVAYGVTRSALRRLQPGANGFAVGANFGCHAGCSGHQGLEDSTPFLAPDRMTTTDGRVIDRPKLSTEVKASVSVSESIASLSFGDDFA